MTTNERTIMPDREVAHLEISIELDPVPGAMHTPESVEFIIQEILTNLMGHYHPQVTRK